MANVPPLTDKDDLERFLSIRGVVAWSDHEECGEADCEVIDEVIQYASEEIAAILHTAYDPAELGTSNLVKHWAKVLASVHLARHRGNPVPESIYAEYERIFEGPDSMINKARIGTITLSCKSKKTNGTPAFSNIKIDRRYPFEKQRVIRQNSSKVPTKLEQDINPDFTFES